MLNLGSGNDLEHVANEKHHNLSHHPTHIKWSDRSIFDQATMLSIARVLDTQTQIRYPSALVLQFRDNTHALPALRRN